MFPLQTVIFPAVTICNLNMIRRSSLHHFPEAQTIVGTFNNFMEGPPEGGDGGGGEGGHGGPGTPSSPDSNSSSSSGSVLFGPPDKRKEAMKDSLNMDSSNAEEKLTLSNVSVDSQAYAEEVILTAMSNYSETVLTKAGHGFHELVFRCNWKDFNCKDG